MSQKEQIKLFEDQQVRTVWDSEKEEWFFSVTDVVEVLTGSLDPKQYIKKMRARDPELNVRWGTICTLTVMTSPSDGKRYRTMSASAQGIFRIIQSIPSRKAEPFKQWMAQVAAERLNQMQNPELDFEQAFADYKRLGYSERWINQRLQTIRARKELTDEWNRAGVTEGQQYASLTDIITKEWSGRTTREYKELKGLKKESLRDNMTTMELALNMVAEAATAEISRAENPKGFKQSAKVAHKGGKIAADTRAKIEAQTGHSIVTPKKASDYISPVEDTEALPVDDKDKE